jgi:methylenetetrahydrofolate dehydrogenase (NADP+)/methenyltetrahydrofolate cyclohydrolase
METKIIKGDFIKDKIFNEVKNETAVLQEKYHMVPGIAFLGFDCVPLAKYNIPLHVQMAQSMGFRVFTEIMPNDSTEELVFDVIDHLNTTKEIHAIVLLQPLPEQLNPVRIVNRIDPIKEVEGFHPMNIMATMVPDIQASRYPMCLPTALFEMFREAEVQLQPEQEWVFLLDDGFVANTLTKMIVRAAASCVVPDDCAVTFINRESKNMIATCKRADVLVVVTKFPEYIQPEWLKQGVCIIDIYSNLVKEIPSKADPARMVPIIRGGINVESVTNIASLLLPIPGGLMTVVMAILFRNTVTAFKNSLEIAPTHPVPAERQEAGEEKHYSSTKK